MNEQEQREFERRQKSRKRLEDRAMATMVAAAEATSFWNAHPEVHQYFHIRAEDHGAVFWIRFYFDNDNETVQLLPFAGRKPLLESFWSDLEAAVTKFAMDVRYEIDRAAGSSGPVHLRLGEGIEVYSGWFWVLKNPAGW
jgi:hypothetical protein